MLRLTVKPDEYLEKLVEYCNMKIYAIATVLETNETWGEEDDFQVLKPNLDIKVAYTEDTKFSREELYLWQAERSGQFVVPGNWKRSRGEAMRSEIQL